MKKQYKIVLIVIICLLVGGFAVLVGSYLFNGEEDETITVLDRIDGYNYTLDDRDTNLMKDTFKELKGVLSKEEVDYVSYRDLLAKLFIIDLFTMNNKINKYDVGSFEYVYPDSINNFKENVEDTIYKHMENNSKGKRNQALPIVKKVNVDESKEEKYTIGDKEYDSYVLNLSWEYERDLGYDKKATLTLIKMDDKLYVVEYKTGE